MDNRILHNLDIPQEAIFRHSQAPAALRSINTLTPSTPSTPICRPLSQSTRHSTTGLIRLMLRLAPLLMPATAIVLVLAGILTTPLQDHQVTPRLAIWDPESQSIRPAVNQTHDIVYHLPVHTHQEKQ